MVPFDRHDRYEPRHPEVLRINPKRQVPVLVHGEVELFDSTLIFEYLEDAFPEPPLWPKGAAARAEARLLELKADDVVFMNIVRLFGLEETPDDPKAVAARAAAHGHYAEMEAQLGSQDYLAGPFSYADIGFFMAQFYGERKGAVMSEATSQLLAWRERVLARPAVRIVIGRMERGSPRRTERCRRMSQRPSRSMTPARHNFMLPECVPILRGSLRSHLRTGCA
jgi:glutathione S-transferase